MGSTSPRGFRYPESTVLANTLHTQIKNLADDVEAKVPIDTGWVTGGTINVPNVPCTTSYYKRRRVGNTVEMRAMIVLTGGISTAYVDLPYPMATDTILNGVFKLGCVRAIKQGVAWFAGDIIAERLSPGRASVNLDSGAGTAWTTTVPATWASGDLWMFDIKYEAAP